MKQKHAKMKCLRNSGRAFRKLKILKIQRQLFLRKVHILRHLGIKKAPYSDAYSRYSNGQKMAFLVQNVKNKFLHQLLWGGIRVIQPLTFGINLTQFGNYLHRFHCSEISHTSHIIFRSPRRSQFQPRCNCLLAALIWRIKRDHEILKVIKEHWEK